MAMREHQKQKIENKEFHGEIAGESFEQYALSQVYAKSIAFKSVSFKQASFAGCYFRNCHFIDCDFTGASIKESNFRGATFANCKFHYTVWEKTFIDEEFLDSCLPSEENLSRDLVRALRVNFAQIGNYVAVNRAAALEVKLTGNHLYNAAFSNQAYYRNKYRAWGRVKHGLSFLKWKALDLLWGNGESLPRVVFSGMLFILLASFFLREESDKNPFIDSLVRSIEGFWGISASSGHTAAAVALIVARYIFLGLFMAILVKRLSRR